MSQVDVCELSAWGFDDCAYRPPKLSAPPRGCLNRPAYVQENPLQPVPAELAHALALRSQRPDLAYEMRGLQWSTSLVDLRALLSFQRRLALQFPPPQDDDLQALIDICFPPPKPVQCDVYVPAAGVYVAESHDPNLQMHTGSDAGGLSLYAGSPFLEVAEYRGRWFLRDGYHRAYSLLRRHVTQVPAVVVQARTLAELGATKPWFFPEEVLFSDDPPRVTDFLDPACTVGYTRPALLRRLRVTVEESFLLEEEGEPI